MGRVKNYPSFVRDPLLFPLFFSLAKTGQSRGLDGIIAFEGRYRWILKCHRVLKPPCRIFTDRPSDLSARAFGKKLIFPVWLNFCVPDNAL